jgi:AcrR family transcriptional regulator
VTTPTKEPRGADGRKRLLDAAEQLLDESGIDGTTAAAITHAAGHRNAAAVNYHFGKLDNLIEAVLQRRSDLLNEKRHALFDELEAAGPVAPRDAFVAMVKPLVELLESVEGRRYLRLLNQAANHPRFHARAEWRYTSSVERGSILLLPLVEHLEPDRRQDRGRRVIGLVLYALADQAWLIDSPQPHRTIGSTEDFLVDLTEMALAALSA